MTDNKNLKDGRDRSKVDMNDDNEVNYVLKAWGITRKELQEAYEATKSNVRIVLYNYINRPKIRP